MQLIKAYENFIRDKRVENCADSTVENYKTMIMLFIKFIGPEKETFEIIESSAVKDYILYLKDHGKTGKTIHTYVKHIKVFYRWMVQNNLLEYNSITDLRVKYEKKLPEILTLDEIDQIFKILNIRDRLILVMILDCGIRKREIINLQVSNVKKDRIFIKLGKGRKDRVVPISEYTYKLFQTYLETRPGDTGYLFQQYYSEKPLGYAGLRMVFRRLKESTGIDRIHAHLLRHTYGTYYINTGGDIKVLQLLLGHSEVQTTETYIHLANLINVEKYSKFSIIEKMTKKDDG